MIPITRLFFIISNISLVYVVTKDAGVLITVPVVEAVQQQRQYYRSLFGRIINRNRNTGTGSTGTTSSTLTITSNNNIHQTTTTPVHRQQTTDAATTSSSIESTSSSSTGNWNNVNRSESQQLDHQQHKEKPSEVVKDDEQTNTKYVRPKYVRDLLLHQEEYIKNMNISSGTGTSSTHVATTSTTPPIIYYFGLGSNMLRSKLENRGNGFASTGTNTTSNITTANDSSTNNNITNTNKIEIISMEPAHVKNYRLSFNLRGFFPLEPGMGSLEPIEMYNNYDNNNNSQSASTKNTIQLLYHKYEKPECHGALVALTVDNYEKVMRSEGIGPNITNPGYEEIVVTVIPYNTSHPPVQAIALRAREHVRLPFDPTPSQRYMKILQQGAIELQLKSCYQQFLLSHPVQNVPKLLKRIAIYNLIFTISFSSIFKWRGISKLQNYLLYKVYVPSLPIIPLWKRTISNICMGCILLPGACFGQSMQLFCSIFNTSYASPMIKRFIGMMDDTSIITNTTSVSSNATSES
jgi:hypothetical protein